MPSRHDYVIGRTGSYLVPTLALLDATITRLTAQIETAGAIQRNRLWDDIDALLERRSAMTADKAVTQ